nr:unnamed protein product [Digitaria exilis]CAB3455645.1 unnamed protein product [Digitaria exilis]
MAPSSSARKSSSAGDDCLAVRCTVTVVEVAAVKDGYGIVKKAKLCDCDDELCKRRHRRRRPEGLTKALLRFCLSADP